MPGKKQRSTREVNSSVDAFELTYANHNMSEPSGVHFGDSSDFKDENISVDWWKHIPGYGKHEMQFMLQSKTFDKSVQENSPFPEWWLYLDHKHRLIPRSQKEIEVYANEDRNITPPDSPVRNGQFSSTILERPEHLSLSQDVISRNEVTADLHEKEIQNVSLYVEVNPQISESPYCSSEPSSSLSRASKVDDNELVSNIEEENPFVRKVKNGTSMMLEQRDRRNSKFLDCVEVFSKESDRKKDYLNEEIYQSLKSSNGLKRNSSEMSPRSSSVKSFSVINASNSNSKQIIASKSHKNKFEVLLAEKVDVTNSMCSNFSKLTNTDNLQHGQQFLVSSNRNSEVEETNSPVIITLSRYQKLEILSHASKVRSSISLSGRHSLLSVADISKYTISLSAKDGSALRKKAFQEHKSKFLINTEDSDFMCSTAGEKSTNNGIEILSNSTSTHLSPSMNKEQICANLSIKDGSALRKKAFQEHKSKFLIIAEDSDFISTAGEKSTQKSTNNGIEVMSNSTSTHLSPSMNKEQICANLSAKDASALRKKVCQEHKSKFLINAEDSDFISNTAGQKSTNNSNEILSNSTCTHLSPSMNKEQICANLSSKDASALRKKVFQEHKSKFLINTNDSDFISSAGEKSTRKSKNNGNEVLSNFTSTHLLPSMNKEQINMEIDITAKEINSFDSIKRCVEMPKRKRRITEFLSLTVDNSNEKYVSSKYEEITGGNSFIQSSTGAEIREENMNKKQKPRCSESMSEFNSSKVEQELSSKIANESAVAEEQFESSSELEWNTGNEIEKQFGVKGRFKRELSKKENPKLKNSEMLQKADENCSLGCNSLKATFQMNGNTSHIKDMSENDDLHSNVTEIFSLDEENKDNRHKRHLSANEEKEKDIRNRQKSNQFPRRKDNLHVEVKNNSFRNGLENTSSQYNSKMSETLNLQDISLKDASLPNSISKMPAVVVDVETSFARISSSEDREKTGSRSGRNLFSNAEDQLKKEKSKRKNHESSKIRDKLCKEDSNNSLRIGLEKSSLQYKSKRSKILNSQDTLNDAALHSTVSEIPSAVGVETSSRQKRYTTTHATNKSKKDLSKGEIHNHSLRRKLDLENENDEKPASKRSFERSEKTSSHIMTQSNVSTQTNFAGISSSEDVEEMGSLYGRQSFSNAEYNLKKEKNKSKKNNQSPRRKNNFGDKNNSFRIGFDKSSLEYLSKTSKTLNSRDTLNIAALHSTVSGSFLDNEVNEGFESNFAGISSSEDGEKIDNILGRKAFSYDQLKKEKNMNNNQSPRRKNNLHIGDKKKSFRIGLDKSSLEYLSKTSKTLNSQDTLNTAALHSTVSEISSAVEVETSSRQKRHTSTHAKNKSKKDLSKREIHNQSLRRKLDVEDKNNSLQNVSMKPSSKHSIKRLEKTGSYTMTQSKVNSSDSVLAGISSSQDEEKASSRHGRKSLPSNSYDDILLHFNKAKVPSLQNEREISDVIRQKNVHAVGENSSLSNSSFITSFQNNTREINKSKLHDTVNSKDVSADGDRRKNKISNHKKYLHREKETTRHKRSSLSPDSDSELEMDLIKKQDRANYSKRLHDLKNNPILSSQSKFPFQGTSRRILNSKARVIGSFNYGNFDSGKEAMCPNEKKQKLHLITKEKMNIAQTRKSVLSEDGYKPKRKPRWITKQLLKEVKVKLSKKLDRGAKQVEVDKVIFKLMTFVKDITSYKRKTGLTVLIDEFIRYLYKCGLIRTCMDYYAFCTDYLPPQYIHSALKDPLGRTTKSKVLGTKLVEDLQL